MDIQKTRGKLRYLKKKYWVAGPVRGDLLVNILLLAIFGLVMIYSASYVSSATMYKDGKDWHFVKTQAFSLALGIVALFLAAKVDYHTWTRYGILFLVPSILLLVILKAGLGKESLGATRWVKIGPVSFQAAEPIKPMLMFFYAWVIGRFRKSLLKRAAILWLVTLVFAGLMWKIADNMSTALILCIICYGACFVSGKRGWIYALIGILVVAGFYLLIQILDAKIPADSSLGFRLTRIRAFLHPEDYAYAEGMQQRLSLMAIGSGGVFGRGLGKGLVKLKLSEAYNDFILAVVAEELGFFGVGLLLFLFGHLLYQAVKITDEACDLEGKILGTCIVSHIAAQVLLNLMVTARLFPTTGVTLPFMSYGGTSVLFLLAELGLLFSIDNYSKNKRFRRIAIQKIRDIDLRRKA